MAKSYTTCIAQFGGNLSDKDRNILKEIIADKKADGVKSPALEGVNEYLETLKAERADLVARIEKQGGVVEPQKKQSEAEVLSKPKEKAIKPNIRGLSTAEDNGVYFETGKPVTFNYAHNTESATMLFGVPDKDSPYGRGYEPSAQFVTVIGKIPKVENQREGMEYGSITFNNPLVIDNDSLNWKKKLSEDFNGATGKKLSQAVIKAGYDGIVTTENGHTSEAINLQTFNESQALYSRLNKEVDSEVKNLAIIHNLSASNVIHANEIGGLAVPSIAVVNKDFPMSGFGWIKSLPLLPTNSPLRF
ncbi:MAG: hypothetical protein ACPHHR_09440 [Cycloclasticus sp.]